MIIRLVFFSFIFLASSTLVFAQQPLDAIGRLSTTVAQLLSQLERQTDDLNTLKQQVTAKDAKIKELETKLLQNSKTNPPKN